MKQFHECMLDRFNTITNDVYALGKSYTSLELVNKILRSFPKVYQSKVVAIQEARDLSKLPLEEWGHHDLRDHDERP